MHTVNCSSLSSDQENPSDSSQQPTLYARSSIRVHNHLCGWARGARQGLACPNASCVLHSFHARFLRLSGVRHTDDERSGTKTLTPRPINQRSELGNTK